ncbi:MAG: paraquat-inducible protein A [Stappiaceae bacterium]
MRTFLALLLPLSAFSFALGLTLPLVRLETLYFFEETPSLLAIVYGLVIEADYALAGVVALFSILFPAGKILLLSVVSLRGEKSRSVAYLGAVGKWSMMDVMLVALVVFGAKTSGLASAVALPGLWFYAAATLFSAIAAVLARRSASMAPAQNAAP